MKRLALLLLLVACDREQRVDRYIEARIPPAPGSDASVADERLIGLCIRGGAGQVLGRIVAVNNDAATGRAEYVVAPRNVSDSIAVPASEDVPGLIVPCA